METHTYTEPLILSICFLSFEKSTGKEELSWRRQDGAHLIISPQLCAYEPGAFGGNEGYISSSLTQKQCSVYVNSSAFSVYRFYAAPWSHGGFPSPANVLKSHTLVHILDYAYILPSK